MKRAVLTLAAVCVLACALVAAPAMSLRPYVAPPVDFELAGPAVTASAAGPYRSPVIRAPKRFNLVGMRWRSAAQPDIQLRARLADGRWTPWTHAPADADDAPDEGSSEKSPRGFSAPVWTGDAEYVQYRLSRMVPGLRLHFVNALGTATRADRLRTTVRRAAHTAAVAVASVVSPARAADAMPPINPRSSWGEENCVPRGDAAFGEVKAALVHHTVSANDYAQDEVPAIVLSICRYHRNSNGWNDIGYNFLVDKYGGIWEGRAGGMDQPVIGAQAQGFNSQTTGIADIGTHTDVPATAAELDAFARLIRWKLPVHGQPTSGTVTLTSAGGSQSRYPRGQDVEFERVSGHRDAGLTTCPGDAMYGQLPDLRARVGNIQPGVTKARTRIAATLAPTSVVYPRGASVAGRLTQVNGEPVGGVEVQVQAFGSTGWRTAWRGNTAADGAYNIPVAMKNGHLVRAFYGGDDGRLPATSKSARLTVSPGLTLTRSVARRAVGETVKLSGSINPSKVKLVLVVERRTGKQRARGTIKLRTKSGRIARTYRFHSEGLFRFYLAFPGDGANAPAKSGAVYVRATPKSRPATPQGGSGEPTTDGGGGTAAGVRAG